MPYYYDVTRGTTGYTSNGSANTESTHLRSATAANQETCAIKGIFVASRFATAGGAQLRVKSTVFGTAASGGTAVTAYTGSVNTGGAAGGLVSPRNLRGNPAAQTTWFNDATGITGGTAAQTAVRLTIGFAQTGGMGGWVPVEAPDALVMMPNATNPLSMEYASICATASVTFDATVEFSEGY